MAHRCVIVLTLCSQLENSVQYMDFNSVETYDIYSENNKENSREHNTLRGNDEENPDESEHATDLPEQIEYDDVIYMRNLKDSDENLVQDLDNSFRDLISMKDVTYTYKRGPFWRTWRELKKDNGTKELVSYSCKGIDQVNGTKAYCGNGLWAIDEKPPQCPYEIFSMKTDFLFCGIHHMNLTKDISENDCPEITRLIELSAQSSPNIIVDGHGKFYLTSIYKIQEGRIIFTLANATGDVIYSKIMMPLNVNYYCIDNCGSIFPNTSSIHRVHHNEKSDSHSSNEATDYEEVTAKTYILNLKDVKLPSNDMKEKKDGGHEMKIKNAEKTTAVTGSQCKQLLRARIPLPDDFDEQ